MWPLNRIQRRFPAPAETFTGDYGDKQRALLTAAMSEPGLQRRFARRPRLPAGYGIGLDERVVELPWMLPRLRGEVLDAGSSCNHAHVLDRVLPQVAGLTIVTAAPEPHAFPERGVTYAYADFRALPFTDGAFDTIACVSSLEHVGMDNGLYGGPGREPDADAAVAKALDELVRVLRPDGTLLVTVPFGAPEDHGWFRQYGPDELAVLQADLGARGLEAEITVFAYSPTGWRQSTPAAANGAHYRDWHADPTPVPDRAAAARAVACIEACTRGRKYGG
jgi:SAM-dependent methyltransferase